MSIIEFGNHITNVVFHTESFGFEVNYQGQKFQSDEQNPPYFMTNNNEKILFCDAQKVEHTSFNTGIGKGIRSRFINFTSNEILFEIEFETYMWVETETGYLRFEFIPLQEDLLVLSKVVWPSPIKLQPSSKGYTVLPFMQGVCIPDFSEQEIKPSLTRRMFSRECIMPWWGQSSDGHGYMAIVETPWDAEYDYYHKARSSTSVNIHWIGSLGKINYRRKLTLRFFTDCSYVSFCKEYRQYAQSIGIFVTLKEKIARNPKVGELIGIPIIANDIIHWNCEPESDHYNKEKPEENYKVQTFDNFAMKIERLKTLGIEKAYIHIDGWGKHGYDNLHPDILPPSIPAGGTDGMVDMLTRIKKLDYITCLHDQYRDYYVRAETYHENQAALLPDNTLEFCSMWPGGKQAMLCAQLAPQYVTRNYNRMQELNIRPDGAYLDVFSIVELDECINPMHMMTRKECMEKRIECFELIRSRGMIVSSEEPVDQFAAHLDLVHHGPYGYSMWDFEHVEPFGLPIPLFNLVYHDCLIIPWSMGKNSWGLPKDDVGMLHALLNGGMPYMSENPDQTEIDNVRVVAKLHKAVATSEMLSHSFIDGIPSKQETVFSCNTKVMVDFPTGEYVITWADQTMTTGKV